MGLATIDPRSQKEHTEIHKIPKFGVNLASFDDIQRFKNVKINKEMYGHPDAVFRQPKWPYISLQIFYVFKCLYLSQN